VRPDALHVREAEDYLRAATFSVLASKCNLHSQEPDVRSSKS
jgi:hypothetical protein